MKFIGGVLLAVVGSAVAQTGPCKIVNSAQINNKEEECVYMGCRWSGGQCQQPDVCDDEQGYIKYQGRDTGVYVQRQPIDPEVARLCDANPGCTAIYTVELDSEFTTGPPNCNDMGMLPPHGRDQGTCNQIFPELLKDRRRQSNNDLHRRGWKSGVNRESDIKFKDYINHPFPEDATKQNVARGANAVTALMEETRECWDSQNCAFPLGFATDTILKGKAVCIEVKNAKDKWVEIMASSRQGSDGGSFCSKDWDSEGADEACTKEGDLYECRESGNTQFGDSMKIKFVAQDNTDDANMEIYWRIVASKLPEGKTGVAGEEKDAEDWCQFRDSSDYPMSLMGAYPTGYDGKPVFQVEQSHASRAGAAAAATIAAVAGAVIFL